MAHIVYGGTFDPVHRGHIAIARAVADVYQDTVWLMLAADPPHRAPPGASAGQRAQMLDLALAGEPRLAVDRRELRRQGPSYTVDTLAELRRELGAAEAIIWVMGIDSSRSGRIGSSAKAPAAEFSSSAGGLRRASSSPATAGACSRSQAASDGAPGRSTASTWAKSKMRCQ